MMTTPRAERKRNTFRFIQAVFNPLSKTILRSPLHGVMSSKLLLITFTGRKSGKEFTTPISYVRQGNTLLLAVGGSWWKNLRGGATVWLRLQGERCFAVTEVVTDEEAMSEVYQIILAKNPTQGRFMGIKAGSDGKPDPDDLLRAIERGAAVVKVHLKANAAV
ncbi:MAG TPA: nitroreductase/quinone reductase family protein [Ktedonobacteraceae bacterium]